MPAGYLAAEFLESNQDAGANAEMSIDNLRGFRVLFSQNTPINAAHLMNSQEPYISAPKWGADGSLASGFGSVVYSTLLFSESKHASFVNYKNDRKIRMDEAILASDLAPLTRIASTIGIMCSYLGYSGFGYPFFGKVYNVQITEAEKIIKEFVPVLNPYGVPCFYETHNKTEHPSILSKPFIVGFTLPQARNLSRLPATGGSLTVSLPWEAQLVITGVPAALQATAAKGWTITVQYREPEADNEYYNKYAECETVAQIKEVNPDYKNDLTEDGEWVYPLPELKNSAGAFARSANLVSFDADLPKLTYGHSMFRNMPKMKKFKGSLKALKNGAEMFCYSDSITDFDSTLESLTEGIYMFLGSQLNKESALKILHSLPSYTTKTHNFHIGIHVDYKQDEEVLAAIAAAEAKGWNLGVNWNGTATAQTASTFGLRKPPIYAKLGTVERPDGTSEQILDWGHYVTNWEENGYQEFGSVEEAEEHFNIKQTEEA